MADHLPPHRRLLESHHLFVLGEGVTVRTKHSDVAVHHPRPVHDEGKEQLPNGELVLDRDDPKL